MKLTLNWTNSPHNGKDIDLIENGVNILVGPNGSGKSRILQALKQVDNDRILLQNNYVTRPEKT
ncbi:MAG: AAA family ATPase [Cyclobacteriaceae bacterium]